MVSKRNLTRRKFLTHSAVAGGALTLAGANVNLAAAPGGGTIGVGLVGCGKRGVAAAKNCVQSARGVKVVALADAFADAMSGARTALGVDQGKCFAGLDAYKKLLALDEVNLVILATPPVFRPVHFAAAVAKGKHVFLEAPVAICTAGVEMVIAASKAAAADKLAVVAGTQRRHDPAYVETMKRIHDGAIGEIVNAQCYCNLGGADPVKRRPGQSDVEWQIRNWPFFRWLSGDLIIARHAHNIDVINWAFNAIPEAVQGLSGRQYISGPEYGDVYDHFGTEITYANDVQTISTCRQIKGADVLVGERVFGTKGTSNCAGIIEGEKPWKYRGGPTNAYVQEHADMIASIRAGKPLNEGEQAAVSVRAAIMARVAGYSRRRFQRSWFDSKCKMNWLPDEALKLSGTRPVGSAISPASYKLPGLSGGGGKRRR